MDRADFDDYIRRFNAQDATAFDDYLAPDVSVLNGTLPLRGVQEFKAHYRRIWENFTEVLHIERFVSDMSTLAVQMWTHFEAQGDDEASLFGPVKAGETFDFRGLVLYRIEQGRFTHITVAYNSFVHTDLQGRQVNLGVPH